MIVLSCSYDGDISYLNNEMSVLSYSSLVLCWWGDLSYLSGMIVLSGVYDLRFSFSQYFWDFASVSIFLVRYHFDFRVLERR